MNIEEYPKEIQEEIKRLGLDGKSFDDIVNIAALACSDIINSLGDDSSLAGNDYYKHSGEGVNDIIIKRKNDTRTLVSKVQYNLINQKSKFDELKNKLDSDI